MLFKNHHENTLIPLHSQPSKLQICASRISLKKRLIPRFKWVHWVNLKKTKTKSLEENFFFNSLFPA